MGLKGGMTHTPFNPTLKVASVIADNESVQGNSSESPWWRRRERNTRL